MTTNALLDAVQDIGSSFDEYKKTEATRYAELKDRIEQVEAKADRPGKTTGERESKIERQHREEFAAWLRKPRDEARKHRLSDAQSELAHETKDVSIGTDAAGGYALPKQIWSQVEYRLRQQNPFRQLCTVVNTSSNDFHYLVSMGDASSGWVAETGSRAATTAPTLRDRVPTMGEVYAYPTASDWSLDDLAFNVQEWLTQEIADDFSAAEATAFVSGNGSARPTGFLNGTPTLANDDGTGVSPQALRSAEVLQYMNLTSASSPEVLDYKSLVSLVHSLNERYLVGPNVAWVMNRTTLSQIHQLVDSTGQPIIHQNPAAGLPMSILGFPVFTTNAMPTYAANAYAIAFGSWPRGYVIADRLPGMKITLNPYSTPGVTAFYCRRRVGGIILNNDAIKILKIAA